MNLTATVILPTCIDRGPTLALAVESVLRQTVVDLELFIIGDGVHESTRQVIKDLVAQDSRVRFFDFPKSKGRGESYRSTALQEAKGRIVCYQVDRDLWFPDHVEEMNRLLTSADVATSLIVRAAETGWDFSLTRAYDDPLARRRRIEIPLAFGAHTLAAYRSLAEGWTATPPNEFTDSHFWAKFMGNLQFNSASGKRLTVLNLPRGTHPGWKTAERLAAMQPWTQRLATPQGCTAVRLELGEALAAHSQIQAQYLRAWFLLCGEPLGSHAFRKAGWRIRIMAHNYFLRRPEHPLTRLILRVRRRP